METQEQKQIQHEEEKIILQILELQRKELINLSKEELLEVKKTFEVEGKY